MDQKINDLPQLYEDAQKLYTDVVKGKADSILNNLDSAISTLKNSWKGKDAGVQINNVVTVYNGVVAVRNALADLAKNSSVVANDYFEILSMNAANVSADGPITIDEVKQPVAPYEDSSNSIDITTEAVNGKSLLDNVNDQYDEFVSTARAYHDSIMGNWLAGPHRNDAEEAFSTFDSNSAAYKKVISEVSQSVATAIKNYNL